LHDYIYAAGKAIDCPNKVRVKPIREVLRPLGATAQFAEARRKATVKD
jgi:hypothetical protein